MRRQVPREDSHGNGSAAVSHGNDSFSRMTFLRRFPISPTLPILIILSTFLTGCRQSLSTGAPDRAHPAGSAPVPSAQSLESARETVDLESAELLVSLRPGTDPAAIAHSHRLTWRRALRADPDMHVFAASSGDTAQTAKETLAADARVRHVYLNSPSRNEPFDR